MSAAFASDLRAMMYDLGVPVTLGGVTLHAFVDAADEMMLASGAPSSVAGRHIAVTIPSESLPAVAPGARLSINGAPHIVREVLQLDDGALTRLLCAKG